MGEHTTRLLNAPALLAASIVALACGGGGDAGGSGLSGTIQVDGSSTVYPISEAMAEEFGIETGGDVRVALALSGTGGGFKRFCAGETAISNASRPISDSERELCASNGIEFLEVTVARDGLAVLTHPENEFLECLTTEDLRRIWEPGSTVNRWSDVRPDFPNEPMRLYGPGTNSGTFDYFTEVITGETGASRADYTASEDDNVLVQGVEGDRYSLGYFGYAYYQENQGRLKLIAVDGGNGCVQPTPETVRNGEYQPLSRPLFIYASRQALERPEVRRFVEFTLEAAPELVPEVGYIPLEAAEYEAERQELQQFGGVG